MTDAPRLNRLEIALLGVLAAVLIAFGVVVEIRSAFLTYRQTDLGVYTRAAWAVGHGGQLYDIMDDRGWHYCYPSPFAILLRPLADPPAGEARTGYLPFAVSVAVWYLFSLACVWFALDRFANSVLPHEPRGSRRWWYARTGPFFVAIGGIGFTLARGQVNLLVLAMLAAMFADHVRGRRFTAGLWLGAAICLKVIPAFLGMYLLLKRDGRGIAGAATALLMGLLVLPACVWGFEHTLELNRQMVQNVLQPGTTGHGGTTHNEELTNATATASQSFQSAIHNWRHPNFATRPKLAATSTRLIHWLIGGLLTLAILVAARHREVSPANELLVFGSLGLLMLHLTPVSHMHYYAYGLPFACGLWLKSVSANPGRTFPRPATLLALAAWGIATALPLFPGPVFDVLRSDGLGQAASLGALVFAMVQLRRKREPQQDVIAAVISRPASLSRSSLASRHPC